MSQRTLWEEGRKPGRQVITLSAGATLAAVLADLLVNGELTLLFDVAFILVCIAAALAVRPRDFFVVGVFPPLLLLGTVTVLCAFDPGAVAEPDDGAIQAVVSGLAHAAGALVVGYSLTLGVLAMRQMAFQQRLPAQATRRRREDPVTGPDAGQGETVQTS